MRQGWPVSRLSWDGNQWRVRLEMRLSDMDLLAVLATHAAAHGQGMGDLAPGELYDRIQAFLWTNGREAVRDTLTLPDEAVGWARRQLDSYQRWQDDESLLTLSRRGRRAGRRRSAQPLAPE